MATYNQVSYGSQGSDVTELQKLLNKNGYSLDTDGIFGDLTQAAVKDYQQKNGLDVDGIVGNNTWGALTKANTTAATTPTTTQTTTPTTPAWSYDDFQVSESTAAADKNRQDLQSQKPGDFAYGEYEKSDIVKQAEAMLQQQLSQKPGAYQSAWQTQLDETLQKILNREKFTYDLNGDALYQQYKDQYMLQGQQAMMDTMGQAAALTGGYGNSYAQTVGQQTYQGYLQQLNDRIPELYQLALNQYNQEGQDLYNQYGLYADREEQDYGRYRDQVGDYYTELDRLTEDARYQGEQDYGKYMDALNLAYGVHRDNVGDWQTEMDRATEDYWNQYSRDYGQYTDDRTLSYQQYQDKIAADQWAQSMAYQQERDKVADEQWQAQFDEAVRQYNHANGISSGSSTGTTGGTGDSTDTGKKYTGSNIDNGSLDESDIKKMQDYLGLSGDGLWGDNSRAAAQKKWGVTSADEAWKKYQAAVSGGDVQMGISSSQLKAFQNKIHSEAEHDAVMRDMYGSYKQYLAEMIANSGYGESAKAYLIWKYGISESDANFKPKKTV